ncbi:MAG: translocation/assembly module TamB domain-containing protein [Novosphingobium sp.]
MEDTQTPEVPKAGRVRKALRALVVLAAGVLIGLAGFLIWLDTDSGHRFIARQIEGTKFENGMTLRIGRIDGSIYTKPVIKDFVIGDPSGRFLVLSEARLNWRPLSWLAGHVDIRTLDISEARLDRLPAFRKTRSEGPFLPDIDIDIGRLTVRRIDLDQAITGQAHRLSFDGKVHIADRRAQVEAQARALEGPGLAGGDRLAFKLDAVPENNRLDIVADLTAPPDGMLAKFTGLREAIKASIAGKGDWASWQGRLEAGMGGGKFAELAIGARNGTFAFHGNTWLAPLLGQDDVPMFRDETRIDLVAALDHRRADLAGTLTNAGFHLGIDGIADFGESRFGQLALTFRQLRPGALLTGLSADSLAGTVTLNGAFARPAVTYDVTAARLAIGATAIMGLHASGAGKSGRDHLALPLNAQAARITGLGDTVDELLTHVRVTGPLAIKGSRVLSDSLAIRSDQIVATATLAGDFASGRFASSLDGRAGNYAIASVGRFDVRSGLELETGKQGFRLAGDIRVESKEISNSLARNLLGGNGLLATNIALAGDGVLHLSRLRIAAPSFRIADGSGTVSPNGALRFTASGASDSYGPLDIALSGTIAAPVVLVHAERPGLGVGLADLRLELRGNRTGYALVARGDSNVGPFDANIDILSASAPLTLDVARLNLGGAVMSGRLVQSAAGPFAGTLVARGSGIQGHVQLLAAGEYQRAVIDATANQARFPGPAGLSAGRGIITADLIFYDSMQVTADIQLARATLGKLVLDRARAKVDYRGGSGSVQLLANGNRGTAFEIAANAQMAPQLWLVALSGSAGGVGFRTISPARIDPAGGEYGLAPTRLLLRQGSVELSGHYGREITVHSTISNIDLAVLRPLMPELGLGGAISGTVDYTQPGNAMPRAQARLLLSNFTRAGPSSLSRPVDLEVAADLAAQGGSLRMLARKGSARFGRLQINIASLPAGQGDWLDSLFAAPIGGGIRYNGPADTLFALAALPDQRMTGPIAVAADFSGSLRDPLLAGAVRADTLTYDNDTYGTRLSEMRLRATFRNDRLEVSELTAKAGEGTVAGSGYVSLSSAKGYPLQLGLQLDNAQVAAGQGMAARASGALTVANAPGAPALIEGTLRLPETRYRLVRQSAAQVRTLSGIRRKSDLAPAALAVAKTPALTGVPADWRLAVDVRADNRIFISGMGLDSEWSADLKIRGTTAAPSIGGGLVLRRGTLDFAGRKLELQPGGRLTFNEGNPANPSLSITARGKAEDVDVAINLSGSALDPQVRFSSTPSLPQDEILARILFGNSVGNLSALQAVQLASSLNALRGAGGRGPLGVLQTATGVDRLRILGDGETNGQGTAFGVGKYISNDIYVEIVTNARGYTATQIEVSLTRSLSVLSEVSSFGGSNVNLRFRKDY